MAAQLSVTKGLPARGPKDAMYFAMTSLPVPVSPRMRTVDESSATRRAFSSRLFQLAEFPTAKFCSFSRRQMPDAIRGVASCVRRLTTSRRLWMRNGLTMKSVAPAFMASMASETAAWPEMITKGTAGALPRTSKRRSIPDIPGSIRSQKMTS